MTNKRAPRSSATAGPPTRNVSFPQGKQVLRFFINSAISNYGVTRENLLNSLCVGGSGTTIQYSVMDTVKLVRVEAWSPPYTSTADMGLSVTFAGSYPDNMVIDDSAVGEQPGHVKVSPPISTQSDDWTSAASTLGEVLFYLYAPAGTIMDLTILCTICSNDSTTHDSLVTTSTLALGQFRFNALDSITNKIRPIGGLSAIA